VDSMIENGLGPTALGPFIHMRLLHGDHASYSRFKSAHDPYLTGRGFVRFHVTGERRIRRVSSLSLTRAIDQSEYIASRFTT
jgi:hypothetical protein